MEYLLAALVGAAVAGAGGLLVPSLIALCPEPVHNPEENPEEYPDHVPFVELAARPGLAWRSALACALAGGGLGLALGWSWALTWLLFLVPVCCALTVIDYVTWYLPTRLIWPSAGVVILLAAAVSVVVEDPGVVVWALLGFLVLGGYYGLTRLISPRSMALGDVRLGALVGAALMPLGPGTVLLSVLAAAVVGALAFLPLKLLGNARKQVGSRNLLKTRIPFGPFIVSGAWLAVLLGQVVAST